MSEGLVVYGDFRGQFKTSQSTPLGNNDAFPSDLSHKVQVYKGSIENVSFEQEFSPEQHRILKSYVLSTVPDIEIHGNSNGPFSDKRVYTFMQLIIIEPKIERTYSMNNATYGELSGKVYGITEKNPQISRMNPSPPPVGEGSGSTGNGPNINGGGGNNQNGNGSGGGISSTDFNNETEIGRIINQSREGCSSIYSGCIANIWRIIGAILLLLFLWWLIRSCDRVIKDNKACDRKERIYQKLKEQERKNKILKEQYEKQLERFLKTTQDIVFYKNSTQQNLISKQQNSLYKWAKVIKTCEDKKFVLIGHHAGRSIENKYADIDIRRAKLIKYNLVKLGVNRKQLVCEGKADKELKYSNQIRQIRIGKQMRYYSRNMRVEIKLKD
jgi:outer membrane protein OmpA-like peptidoglycan-associated protein